ncbi:MAG: PQQ-dependent sugar dehydrogenase, partial [Planctomycetales bacterium]|nr:PQQ-dependent sugar dehydrogenase [Planctomycetales bacterium]
GLLGMAFDPDYASNGYFYVDYTDTTGATRVRRYSVSAGNPNMADANTGVDVLRISQPESNHNGGWIGFSPIDNYLYIATGDGGGANDQHSEPTGNAQDLTDNLLGKILRIDPAGDDFPGDSSRNYAIPSTNPFVGATGDDEIWAYGLRNPWRPSFDRQTGDLYIADVGQNAREEISFQPASSAGGENYGWRLREGTIATPTTGVGGDRPPGAVEPVHDYFHALGRISVTGGYAYRGPIESLQGHYFFADYGSGDLWSFRMSDGQKMDFSNNTDNVSLSGAGLGNIASFGEDAAGNLYVLNRSGPIYRIDQATEAPSVLARGSVWKYLDDGSNPGDAWRSPGFDDSTWLSGLAQLGYGDDELLGGDHNTAVSYGPDPNDKYATTYFRRSFEVSDNARILSLTVDLLADDGAAVYLNGIEVVRTSNLAPDAAYDDFADFNGAGAVGGNDEDTFFGFEIDPAWLVEGTNVVAVEVHQSDMASSDLSFDLGLTARVLPEVGDLDGDGVLTAADIDALAAGVRDGTFSNVLDVNDDGTLNDADRLYLIEQRMGSLLGDTNLDDTVDDADYAMLRANLFNGQTGWSAGDFNGDGLTDGQDFNLWLTHRGMSGSHFETAVPEPATGLLGVASLLIWLTYSRRAPVSTLAFSSD